MKELMVLKDGALLTMDDGPVLTEADLWISGGKIRKIVEKRNRMPEETSDVMTEIPADAQVLDCRGCVIIPGLIDSHVHYDESYMGDFFLASGITSVRNMRGFDGHAV